MRYSYVVSDSSTPLQDGELTDYTKKFDYDNAGRLIHEKNTKTLNTTGTTYTEITYLYDENEIIGMIYGTSSSAPATYYFRRNLQGDVIAICNVSGTRVVEYAYDAYGNCTVIYAQNAALAEDNPIRYRGYYFDVDTGLYYLNARYYNPQWRRFISPDDTAYLDPESVNGLNLYAYCGNDPVNYADPSGHSVILTTALILMGVGATAGLGYAAYTDYQDDYDINGSVGWQTYVGSAIIGGAIGFGIGYFGPSITSFLGSSFSFALPSLGTLNVGSTLAIVGGTTVTITGAQIAGGAIVAGLGIVFFSKHNPKMTNKPPYSWVDQQEGIDAMRRHGGDANKAAKDIMNAHWDTWKEGAGQYYNAIKKWLDRVIRKLL